MNVGSALKGGAAALALAAGLALPAASQAQSYNLFGDFGSSAFAYGSGTNGSSFSAFTNTTTNCFGSPGTLCYNNADGGFPFVGKNESGTPSIFFPIDALSFQPGTTGAGSDALIQFTAPTAGTYTISGFSRSEDPNGGRNQQFTIYDSVQGVSTNLYSTVETGPYQVNNPFGDLTAVLSAGDTITFGVASPNTDNSYQTTGVEAVIRLSPPADSSVPEPVSWAMMIVGFGAIGTGARYRRRRTSVGLA